MNKIADAHATSYLHGSGAHTIHVALDDEGYLWTWDDNATDWLLSYKLDRPATPRGLTDHLRSRGYFIDTLVQS